MAETEPAKPTPRPIIRIGLFLMSHNLLVSVVCCAAGVLALLFLPVLAKNTYISENALMPGSASPMLSSEDVSVASKFVNRILNLNSRSVSSGIEIRKLMIEHIIAMGGEANYHKFQSETNSVHQLHFFASPDPGVMEENFSCSSYSINTVGIIRAPRGDGKESIVLVTPYNPRKITLGEALSLGIAYSVFSLLSRVTWLAKDIIWLAADSQNGEYAAVASWLRDYHRPLFGGLKKDDYGICLEGSMSELETNSAMESKIYDTFRRAGTMAAALVIKVADRGTEFDKDGLKIYAEASNGQMPNLDLINIANYLAVHAQGLQVKVEKVQSLFNSWWLGVLGKLFESLGKVARSLNLQWKIDISVTEYVEGFATLASSLYNQALGIPTGPHGAFRDYQVDAITMDMSSQLLAGHKGKQNELLMRGGRLVEGIIRSVNNLLEKFHQSFFLYLLTSSNKFVSVGVYMIAFGLLVVPLPLVAASLFSDASEQDSSRKKDGLGFGDELGITYGGSWKWLGAAKTVFIVHLWGVLITLLPYFYYHMPKSSSLSSLIVWSIFSILSLLFLRLTLGSSFSFAGKAQPQRTQWAYLKSVTIAAAFIGLCLMSVINFAAAEIGALLLVPMCLMAVPLRLKANNFRTFALGACNMSMLLLGFLPVAFFVFKGALGGFDRIDIGEFWNWMEALWEWSSATYVYICLVHLPCWVLCILILLHPF